MLSKTIIITGILGFLLLGFTYLSNTVFNTEKTDTKQFTALHLVNLQSEDMEGEFLAGLNDFNQVLKEIGYPNIKYEVWKQSGGQDGKYTYFFQSTWPDQATYDKVHSHDMYQAALAKHRSRYEELIAEDVYNRYIPLN